jgi:hypothetical protein
MNGLYLSSGQVCITRMCTKKKMLYYIILIFTNTRY